MNRSLETLPANGVVVAGMPFDAYSSHLRGPALAPAAIRQHLRSGMSNLCTEGGLDLKRSQQWMDIGDLDLTQDPRGLQQVASRAREIGEEGHRLLALGGDHSITYPLVRGCASVHGSLSIVHLDAHPDLYDEFDGSRHSHACPMARIMEAGLATRLVQIGIRTFNAPQRKQAERFGVESFDMRHWDQAPLRAMRGPVYLSVDLDVLDPAFAPGVSHHEPGGMSTRQVLEVIGNLPEPPIGADLVEFNPQRDVIGLTAAVAAKLLKEMLGAMLR